MDHRSIKTSWWWLAAVGTCCVLAVGLIGTAVVSQRAADKPVGEGELFLNESKSASADLMRMLEGGVSDHDAVRHLRNNLTIEAAAVVDRDGAFIASTSRNLIGTPLSNGFLGFGLGRGRLTAVAGPIDRPLSIDGVTEWETGDVLYQVLVPVADDGQALVLYYDISELLARRAREGGIRTATLQLLAIAAFFLLMALVLIVGRSRVRARYQQLAIEGEFLRKQSVALEVHNTELDEARRRAERALALAEEKVRIRGEFVLMINHELRTPLTSVVTGAELLRSGELEPAEAVQIIDDMVHDGSRLQTLIGQLLAVARIENRGFDFELSERPLTEVCETIETATPRLSIGPAPDSNPEEVLAVRLRTEPETLAQIVASLSDNAVTHGATEVFATCSTSLGFSPDLEVGERPSPAAFITVIDNGPGIDHEFLPTAFEKWEKDSFSSGTGLGLYVVRMMAEAIQGSISVSTSPEGTSMAIAVPCAIAEELKEVA